MLEVLALALTFPTVVYTVLLGVTLIYWMIVMTGALHVGDGSDGALEGLEPGHVPVADGGLEGTMGGHAGPSLELEGAGDGSLDGPDGGDGGDAAGDGDHGGAGLLASLLSVFRLRKIPATVALSLVATFSWLVSVVSMQIVSRVAPGMSGMGVPLLVLFGAPIAALPLSAMVSIPLAKVFVQRKSPTKSGLIGMTCRLRTGRVTEKFGEATLEDGGAGLVLQVRVDSVTHLKRGDSALIVDFDPSNDTFLVVPMDTVLGTETRDASRS